MKQFKSILLHVIIAFIVAYILTNYIVLNTRVPTASMTDIINIEDRLFANRLAYVLKKPERGEIIVFTKEENKEKLFVKRIIGLPNETVLIDGGQIFIDGSVLEDSYTKNETIGTFGPFLVPEDSYFVLGDNRSNSNDSRFWQYQYVGANHIVGQIFLKYYPSIQWIN